MVRTTGSLILVPRRPRISYRPAIGAGPAARPAEHLLDWRPFQVTAYSYSAPGCRRCGFVLRSVLHVSDDQYLRAPWSMYSSWAPAPRSRVQARVEMFLIFNR